MNRNQIIQTLQKHEPELHRLGVKRAALFGSLARGNAQPDSDIDLMIEVDPTARVGVFEYVGIIQYLKDLFPRPVDVANYDKLKSLIRPSAEQDAIYAF